ncbi:uncharacterized protein [Medicago truncatula]|uniref:uncharacterized protein n=1 Tax=Medicago truncatula TaxID=3880 RepID=UPI000D2F41A1|nr:uncharacterized protein LOC112422745 [Medicago truncatula]
MWLWNLETSNAFLVCSTYNFLTAQTIVDTDPVDVELLWHKDVPLNVVIFAWRMFRNRLPTKDNLNRRGVLNNNSCLCASRCGSLETASHLFLHCFIFGSVWHFIIRWVGISSVLPYYATDHFPQFSFGGGGSKVRQSILQVIWFAIVWEIWKERNSRTFNGKECSIMRLVDKIKLLSFSWLKAKFVHFRFNYHGWWLSPLAMIGSYTTPNVDVTVQRVPPRLQHDLDLWQHIKEYDKKAAADPLLTAVLTKKQKQMMRPELLDGKPPYSTRSRVPSPTPQ